MKMTAAPKERAAQRVVLKLEEPVKKGHQAAKPFCKGLNP